jgi:hypothetical protein
LLPCAGEGLAMSLITSRKILGSLCNSDQFPDVGNKLTQRRGILLEKLIVDKIVNKFSNFIKLEGSLPYSQQPAIGP